MTRKKLNEKEQVLRRIRIIRGQLAAIEKMIEGDKSSEEILLQLAAIRSAVHQVSILEARQNVRHKIREAIQQGADEEEVYESVQRLLDLNQAIVVPRSIQENSNHKGKFHFDLTQKKLVHF